MHHKIKFLKNSWKGCKELLLFAYYYFYLKYLIVVKISYLKVTKIPNDLNIYQLYKTLTKSNEIFHLIGIINFLHPNNKISFSYNLLQPHVHSKIDIIS